MASPIPMPAPASRGDLTGATIGRYRVQRRLGAGGMGEVYLAEDTTLKRQVALKRASPKLRADWTSVQRLVKEAERASSLSHPSVASVYDILQERGEVLLVMEYVDGETLRHRLPGPLPVTLALHIGLHCCEALQAAHSRGMVHGDFKPENIMLGPGGEVKLLDFGVARRMPVNDETVDDISGLDMEYLGGTPAYTAPEVFRHQSATARADLFALGIVLYEMLAGEHPFGGSGLAERRKKILESQPAKLGTVSPQVPAALERCVHRLLEKKPEDRYPNAGEALEDLRAIWTGENTWQREWMRRWTRLRYSDKFPWAVAAAVLLVVGLGIGMLGGARWSGSPKTAAPPAAEARYVAVLPFRAIGGPSNDGAYAEGMAATLTAKLTQLTSGNRLQVASNEEVHRAGIVDPGTAHKMLGVNLVFQGSLHRAGEEVRVVCELVDPVTLRPIRAETITAPASDPFGMEDKVVTAATRMLDLELAATQRESLAERGTRINVAYDAYVRGQGYLQSDRPEDTDRAIESFGQALSLDKNYAPAHAGLGEAYWRKYEQTRQSELVEPARASCERAKQSDPNLAQAHLCLGQVLSGSGRFDQAEKELQAGLKLEPTSDIGTLRLGRLYQRTGKNELAEQTYRRAVALRPHYWAGYSWLGALLVTEGRYQDAITQVQKAAAMAPDNPRPYYQLGGTYIYLGRYAEATTALQKAITIRPTFEAYSNLGSAYMSLRKYDDAVNAYEQAERLGTLNYVVAGNLAHANYWAPGRRDKSRELYERAVRLAEDAIKVNPRDADAQLLWSDYQAMLGKRAEALRGLDKVLALHAPDAETAYFAAIIHVQTGDADKGLEWLGRAVQMKYSRAEIRNTIEFDGLRNDPRYRALVGP